MLFVNSHKLKFEELQHEVIDIKKAFNEILENADIEYSLRSLKGLKSRLDMMEKDISAILFKYQDIDVLLNQVDVLIADYNEIDIQIDLYELNGIENDLLEAKRMNNEFNELIMQIKQLCQNIHDNISKLDS